MLYGSLAMSGTISFLSHSQATSNNFAISASPRLRNHKNAMCYNLLGNISHAKTYPGFLNISLSIFIAHQLIHISNFSICHFHCTICVKKLLNEKICCKWDTNPHLQCEQLLTQKPKIITISP